MIFQSKNIKQNTKFILLAILFIVFAHSGIFAQTAKTNSGSDTLFNKISIEDLLKIKQHYKVKVKDLRKEEESYRLKGMDWSANFLKEKGVNIADRDKIYIRLAEYYIEDAEKKYDTEVDEYDKKYEEYEKQLALFDNKQIEQEPAEPQFPKFDYSEAITVYDKLLEEYPASDYADDALYGKAWLSEKMSLGAKSRQLYREVIDKYPDSPFAPESYMRLAEYYFAPRLDKTDEEQTVLETRKAIQLYKNVLKYKGSKKYDEALYKLGWSYYKLAAREPKYYNDAITYFILTADDIERAQKLDPAKKISNPNVRNEAIEYIGISFTDEAYTKEGIDKARKLLERINDRPYGPEIMESIGSTYKKIDEPQKAIYAYETLLDMYPQFERAPAIQHNIAMSLYTAGKDAEAYAARQTLYDSYRPSTLWYSELENSDNPQKVKYLKSAYKLSEAALRTNLLLDLEAAEEMDSKKQDGTAYYSKVADECKLYLDIFPADSNAYDVNWSYALLLDSRLGRFEQAFEEYIKVSNDYIENSHQENAAINAVGVADTLVKIKYGTNDSISVNIADVAKLSPEELTPEETRLIEAYDNYIRLFPAGEYTPNFLASAGGIYYNHKKFAESKVYFQTLVRRFPGAEQKSLAMRSIMDSYFALGKFKDSEMVAKRIMSESAIPEDQKKFAQTRMGQAIFKNAEYLEEQGDYFTAATEYFRVFTEAPGETKMVERALLNSGLNFQKSKDWVRAIGAYDTLVTRFSSSKLAVPALQNMAEDYKELEQYSNAAGTYERIFTEFGNSENVDAALYNASFYYKKGQDWNNAIRVNNLYIKTFPTQSFATDLFFANAELYLKLNNVAEANAIYEQFATRFPDDPRTVTAYYERGKYYLGNGQIPQAKAEFNKAIVQSESFKKKGKDPNSFIAGEAVNSLAEILHKEFVSSKLTQPPSNIKAKLASMRSTMKKLNSNYRKVLSFGSPRSFEAVFNIARSYEEFATIYANQEINPDLNETKAFIEKKKINEQSAGLYEKAVEEYKKTVENIPVIAQKLGVSMEASEAAEPMPTDTVASEEEVKRAAESDSTRDLARKWYSKAKDKISELLYTEASLTSENVQQAIQMKAPQKNPVQRIIFRRAILSKVAAPAVKQTIAAHIRNIQEADALGLSNKYVEESKRQVLLTSNIIGSELEIIVESALNEYRRLNSETANLLEKEFGAKTARGLDYYGLDNDANQMLDYVKILSQDVLNAYAKTLVLAEESGIKNDLVKNTQERLLRYSVEKADLLSAEAEKAKERSAYYQARFDSTENYNYDDAAGFFENYMFSLIDNAKSIMEQAFEFQQQYDIHNLWANKLLLRLIRLDPVTYSANIEKEKVDIYSDENWKYSTTYYAEQWTKPDFDDSNWKYAVVVPSSDNPFSALNVNPQAIWTLQPQEDFSAPSADSTFNDSTAFADSTMSDSMLSTSADSIGGVIEPVTFVNTDSLVFFRRTFDLAGTPLNGAVYITADDDYRVYLNGEYLMDDEQNDFAVLDSLDFYTLEVYLKKGKNVITIDVEDKNLTAGGLKLYSYFELLPANVTAAAEEKAKVKKVFVEPDLLRKVNILNKNRISLSKGN